MSPHTPGPWAVDADDEPYAGIVEGTRIGNDTWTVAMALADVPALEREVEANARLIAAAPDLLDSLRSILGLAEIKYGNLHADVTVEFDKARAAIARATGAP